MDNSELYLLFYREVISRAREVDPEEELDWFALGIGWAIAKGLIPDEAYKFSMYARYERHYK